jgi:Response regulator containing a CheY-like receiver domain and an HTH DNA-binding domain
MKKRMKNIYIQEMNEMYFRLLEQQKFVAEDLDYSILEKHKPHLQKLADIGNSVISIFDACEKKHAFYSSNAGSMLGYVTEEIEEGGELFLDTKIHPDDSLMLLQNSISIFKLYLNFSEDEKINHKLINEYRILNASNQYVRVIEQHQALELDRYGNLWLAMSILDISPDQNINEGIKSQVLNFRTGKFIPLFQTEEKMTPALTQREIQILKLVKEGFLSKEISDKLAISLHTVNTHRQRVLEKLGVNNSIEAVILASRLGLI